MPMSALVRDLQKPAIAEEGEKKRTIATTAYNNMGWCNKEQRIVITVKYGRYIYLLRVSLHL